MGTIDRVGAASVAEIGKVKKLALVAAMRKLLVILNTMLREGTPWNPDHAALTNL
jgi:transposase